MKDAFIVDAIRTPIGAFAGTLSAVRADDLAAHAIRELVRRHPALDLAAIDDVILGCANQAGEDNRNVARMALLLAGLPFSVPGETVNRLCASGMSAVVGAARAIAANNGDLFIAGGVEHMTRGPWVMNKTSTPYGRDAQLFDSSFGWRFINPLMKELFGVDAMGETAENLLDANPISREDQDRFALHSQQKAAAAQASGRLAKEIAPVSLGPVRATELALKRAGLTLAQMDVVELNEAFAAQVLSCTRSLGLADDDPRINPNGGAIALGHPLGMSGARLLQTASLELQALDKRYALCTMCIGVGQGYAVVLEKC
ncbi:MAG: 3-oxoadipyl-CoA thiolase [Flavobacteriales bacterium]|nr:3-oxoadipyl-CoA thiolase [Flavobacteriales bacterium]